MDAIALDAHAHYAAAGRGLVGEELRLAEARLPEGAEADVGGAGDGILIDAGTGSEEAGDEIVIAGAAAGDDDTTDGEAAEGAVIGLERAEDGLGFELDDVVEGIAAYVEGLCSQRFEELRRGIGWLCTLGGEIHFDPFATALGGEEAALRVEAGGVTGIEVAFFVEDMGRGQGGVAAESDFYGGSEPAEMVAVGAGVEEGGFGEIHFAGYGLHPGCRRGGGEDADGGGVAGEGDGSEGVYLGDAEGHMTILSKKEKVNVKCQMSKVKCQKSKVRVLRCVFCAGRGGVAVGDSLADRALAVQDGGTSAGSADGSDCDGLE